MPDLLELLLPLPVYLVLLLAGISVYAFRGRGRGSSRWMRGILVFWTVWSWVMATPGFANLAIRVLEGSPGATVQGIVRPVEAPLIVVLASGSMTSRDGLPLPRLDAAGWERLREGIRLWREAGGSLLFTGGPRENSEGSLAGLMQTVALESGVPAGVIFLTSQSSTTYEDVVAAKAIAADHVGPVWLVTSAMHMPRALGVAAKVGLAVQPVRCDYRQIKAPTWRAWLPDNGGPALWSAVLHEVVGRAYYQLRGWSD